MLAFGVLAALGLAGYAGWSWWMAVPAAGLLTLQSWWVPLWRLGEPDQYPWSKKITAYFVTGVVADLVMAVAAFGLGRVLRWMIG
jgi:hypothetical protein